MSRLFARKRPDPPGIAVAKDVQRRVDSLDRAALLSYADLMISQAGTSVSALRRGERDRAVDLRIQAEVVYTILTRLADEYDTDT